VGLFVSLRPFVTWLALTEDLHLPLLLPTNPWAATRPDFWAAAAHPFFTQPYFQRLSRDLDRAFNLRYRGIVGSLGYLVNMTRPDLAFPYSELSKYVECPQPWHMTLSLRVSLPPFSVSLSLTHTQFRYPVQDHWYGQTAGHPRLTWEDGVNVLGRLSWLRRNTCT